MCAGVSEERKQDGGPNHVSGYIRQEFKMVGLPRSLNKDAEKQNGEHACMPLTKRCRGADLNCAKPFFN